MKRAYDVVNDKLELKRVRRGVGNIIHVRYEVFRIRSRRINDPQMDYLDRYQSTETVDNDAIEIFLSIVHISSPV